MLSRTGLCFIGMAAAVLNLLGFSGLSWAQDYGIDFVTIGSPGNAGYSGPDPNGFATGRGAVGYEYRIGRTEITTGQWLDFVNTFSVQSDALEFFAVPVTWGASSDPDYNGPGRRWRLNNPAAAMRPLFGITWRDAALFCNWLHNDRPSTIDGIQNGAYDASTFGFIPGPGGVFTDQRRHNPDARFWIPTWDEWLKSVHYDPNRFGDNQEGWWIYPHGSDSPPISGLPGVGQTSVGVRLPNFAELSIPLGAYPETLTPWGLLDATGGASEWVEETFEERFGARVFRGADGAYAGDMPNDGNMRDIVHELAGFTPTARSAIGLRIASAVPAPSVSGVFVLGSILFLQRRRHQTCSGTDSFHPLSSNPRYTRSGFLRRHPRPTSHLRHYMEYRRSDSRRQFERHHHGHNFRYLSSIR